MGHSTLLDERSWTQMYAIGSGRTAPGTSRGTSIRCALIAGNEESCSGDRGLRYRRKANVDPLIQQHSTVAGLSTITGPKSIRVARHRKTRATPQTTALWRRGRKQHDDTQSAATRLPSAAADLEVL